MKGIHSGDPSYLLVWRKKNITFVHALLGHAASDNWLRRFSLKMQEGR